MLFIELGYFFIVFTLSVNIFQLTVQFFHFCIVRYFFVLEAVNHFTDLATQRGRSPAEVRLENLTDVHT